MLGLGLGLAFGFGLGLALGLDSEVVEGDNSAASPVVQQKYSTIQQSNNSFNDSFNASSNESTIIVCRPEEGSV